MNWMQQVSEFMPHGMCLLWRPELMALHIVSDAAIAASYFAIPIAIAVFVRRRLDLDPSHRILAVLFAAFITLCGLTHLMSIVVLWSPVYVGEGWLKAVTAVASIGTAASLPFLLPQLLAIPSPKALQREVDAHRATLLELEAVRAELARRVDVTEKELRLTNRRFETALRGSPVTVYEQDDQLRYTWAFNLPLGLTPERIMGRTELELVSNDNAQAIRSLKLRALELGRPQRDETLVEIDGRSAWFDLYVEPAEIGEGRHGIIATATEITERRAQEAHLRFLMREMNHRAKNVLAMVISIARQTARHFEVPEAFETRLNERLSSLAAAHDVLASQEWRGADLRAVLEGQLRHHLDTYGDRIVIDGAACELPPEAAHYVGLALHELGSNAVKHGALSGAAGTVRIAWSTSTEDGRRRLHLRWQEAGGPPVAEPERVGFGATILKSTAARALHGRSRMAFEPEGLVWTLDAPLSDADGETATPGATPGPVQGADGTPA